MSTPSRSSEVKLRERLWSSGPPFYCMEVSKRLVDNIVLDLHAGRSVICIGYPGSGKYLLKTRVSSEIRRSGIAPIIALSVAEGSSTATAHSVRDSIVAAIRRSGYEPHEGQSLRELLADFKTRVYLVVTNIDYLS